MTKDLTEGLVLDLDMETLQDYSGNGNDGTATGTTLTTDKDGRLNRAGSFDGNNDYINLGNVLDFTSENFSIRFWAYKDSVSNDLVIFKGEFNTNGWYIQYIFNTGTKEGIKMHTNQSGSSQRTVTNNLLEIQKWNHVVFTRDSSTIKVYINGIEAVYNQNDSHIDPSTSNEDLKIGRYANTSSYDLHGDLFGIKAWDRALSVEEVQLDYSESKHNYVGLFDGLVAGYDFKGDAKDFSGNGYDGTVNGATLTTDKFGIADSAYSFDGVNDYITTSSDLSLSSAGSISMWVKTTSTGNDERFIFKNSGSPNRSFFIAQDNASINFFASNDGSNMSVYSAFANSTINDGVWHHLVFAYDGTTRTMKLYKDGELSDTLTSTDGVPLSINQNTVPLTFGGTNTGSSAWGGDMSKPLFYNITLSADEVKALYDLTSKRYIYPYPQHTVGGFTE